LVAKQKRFTLDFLRTEDCDFVEMQVNVWDVTMDASDVVI